MTARPPARPPLLSRRAALAGACTACAAVAAGCVAPASSPPRPPGGGLVAVADVPVGGGVVIADEDIVVTQPTAGAFKGFSATCTHQSCLVATVTDGRISCACHGSAFSVADGSVLQGPAREPLAEKPVRLDGTVLTLA